jgi:hypothetical protein
LEENRSHSAEIPVGAMKAQGRARREKLQAMIDSKP